MSNWPSRSAGSVSDALHTIVVSGSSGQQLSSNASANSEGAYAQFIASTLNEYAALVLSVQSTSISDYLIDIAVGAGGSEQVIVSNLRDGRGLRHTNSFVLPVAVKKGSRVALRCQASTNSETIEVALHGIQQSFLGFVGGTMLTMGDDATASKGTAVDAGATLDTKGAWTEIDADIAKELMGFSLVWSGNGNNVQQLAGFIFDIAVGAGGSEQIIVQDGVLETSVSEITTPAYQMFPVSVKKDARIAARLQSSINDAIDRILDLTVYGVVV